MFSKIGKVPSQDGSSVFPRPFAFELVDTDFSVVIRPQPGDTEIYLVAAEYEERGLNVAANLFLYCQYMSYYYYSSSRQTMDILEPSLWESGDQNQIRYLRDKYLDSIKRYTLLT